MSRTRRIAERIAELPRPLLLCFDLDGTLAPIVEDPRAARVPKPVQANVARLAQLRGVRVAILTGRDAEAADRMLHVPGIYRGFEHGRIITAPGKPITGAEPPESERRKLDAFEEWAGEHARVPGAALEHKRTSRALHVRKLAKRDPETARALLRAATRAARQLGLHPRPGRWVMEAELEAGDKGVALSRMAMRTRARGVVYAGDDRTDLPAIRRAAELGGLGIFVRSPERPRKPTGASLSVRGPEELAEVIAFVADQLG